MTICHNKCIGWGNVYRYFIGFYLQQLSKTFFWQNKSNGGPRADLLSANSLIHIHKISQKKNNFLAKNWLFICKFRIHGPKDKTYLPRIMRETSSFMKQVCTPPLHASFCKLCLCNLVASFTTLQTSALKLVWNWITFTIIPKKKFLLFLFSKFELTNFFFFVLSWFFSLLKICT